MITAVLPFRVGENHFRCEMQYDETKPYELTFVFRQPCMDSDCEEMHETAWIAGRDLLSEGIDSETWTGVGDIRLRRNAHNSVEIYLSSHEGESVITIPRRPLKDFIRRTQALVRPGSESDQYDWDALDAERVTW